MAGRSGVREVVLRLNPTAVPGDAEVLQWLKAVCSRDIRGHLIGMTNAIGEVLRSHASNYLKTNDLEVSFTNGAGETGKPASPAPAALPTEPVVPELSAPVFPETSAPGELAEIAGSGSVQSDADFSGSKTVSGKRRLPIF
jgi:hypothetical protein